MSRSDEFLTNAIAGAQLLSEGSQIIPWKGSCIELTFTDPLTPETVPSSASANPRAQIPPTAIAPQPSSAPTIDLELDLGSVKPESAVRPEPTFGAVLAEVFLVFSVLSKQDGPTRLPPTSVLHTFPIIGHGKSFTARLVPSSRFKNNISSFHKEKNVVVKSLRHRELIDPGNPRGDERVPRLQNFLRELRVLTHGPLRNHENIVRLLGVGWERNRLSIKTSVFHWPFLVLEHAEYGSLTDFLEENTVDFNTRRDLCLDIGKGLQKLHKCDVIHGDIKLENVLVFSHPTRQYIAKIADFGHTIFDLEGKSPMTYAVGCTEPWEAPEFRDSLSFRARQLTDVYSFGFSVWRCVSYGHYPFDQAHGLISSEGLETIKPIKKTDGIPTLASKLLEKFLEEPLLSEIALVLERTVRLAAAARRLEDALELLALTGISLQNSFNCSDDPIRSTRIPQEQGLGIYGYGGRNVRLEKQNLEALESHCLYATACKEYISRNSDLLLHHGCATLSGHYLQHHFAGDTKTLTHPTPTLNVAFYFLQVSAGAQSTASAEAIVPIAKAFNCDSLILGVKQLSAPAAHALYKGSEFILRDLMLSDAPGKQEFLQKWMSHRCRGVGISLFIPQDVFDGTGARYQEFLSNPISPNSTLGKTQSNGTIDVDHLLHIAAGWGFLEDVQLLIGKFGANVNSRDVHGETALLKACRGGHLEVVRHLVTEAGALANIGSHKNVTPLHWLCSFPEEDIQEVATLLSSARGDPNAVMTEEFGGSEGEYWFFKGPPLMRAVAPGNVSAVKALLGIGADPLIARIGVPGENPLAFAVRRARLDVLKVLTTVLNEDLLWSRGKSGYRLIYHLISASPSYLAKVHLEKFETALVETFDYLWSLADQEKRHFLSIHSSGEIAIQVAVAQGNFPIVKRIVETCPGTGHLKELVVTIGMQTAIVEGRYAIFKYLLSNGGLAHHPVLDLDPDEDSQFETYVTCGPWTQDLIQHQQKTNSLHLCAQAGEYAAKMCADLLRAILPASRWDNTPETLREQHTVNCSCNKPLDIDPIVDCRNELAETPFFCALQAEEYEMAFCLYQVGASQNVTVPHQIVSTQCPGRCAQSDIDEGLPLAEHALTWASAFRALHFIIHFCWGCLRLTSQHGDELRLCVIEETASWPFDEASELFEYIEGRCYPGFKWDKEVVHAIKWCNQAAVTSILRRREQLIPSHQQPQLLYDAVRAGLLVAAQKQKLARAERLRRLTEILWTIKRHYPEHPFGGHGTVGFGDRAVEALAADIKARKERYTKGLVSLRKFEGELNGLLFPWLVCLLCGTGPDRTRPLIAFGEYMQSILGSDAVIHMNTDLCRINFTAEIDSLPDSASPDSDSLRLKIPQENVHRSSVFKRKSLSLLSSVFKSRPT